MSNLNILYKGGKTRFGRFEDLMNPSEIANEVLEDLIREIENYKKTNKVVFVEKVVLDEMIERSVQDYHYYTNCSTTLNSATFNYNRFYNNYQKLNRLLKQNITPNTLFKNKF